MVGTGGYSAPGGFINRLGAIDFPRKTTSPHSPALSVAGNGLRRVGWWDAKRLDIADHGERAYNF